MSNMKLDTKKCLRLSRKREILFAPLSKVDILDLKQGRFVYKHWHTKKLVWVIIGRRKQTEEEQRAFDKGVGMPFIGLNAVLDEDDFEKMLGGVFIIDYGDKANIQLHITDGEEYERETGRRVLP